MFNLFIAKRKTKRLTILALLITLVLAGLGSFCLKEAFSHFARTRSPVPLLLRANDGKEETLIFSDKDRLYSPFPEEARELILLNQSSSPMTVTLPFGSPFTLSPQEKKRIPVDAACTLESFTVKQNDRISRFVSDASSLRSALEQGEERLDIVFLNDIESIEPLRFSTPCRIDTGTFTLTGDLQFTCDKPGELILLSEQKGFLSLKADSPNVRIKAPKGIFSYSEAVADYYLKAEALNQTALCNNHYPINNEEMLSQLAQSSSILSSDALIHVLSPLSLEKDLRFEGAYSLLFDDKTEFNGHKLSFTTNETKEIRIQSEEPLDSKGIVIYAPNANVLWEDPQNTEIEALCETVDAATINRRDPSEYRLGGNAQGKILSFSAHHEDFLRPIQYSVEGNLIIGRPDYLDNFFDLEHATLRFECEGGTLALEEAALNEDGTVDLTKRTTVILTDEQGRTSRYAVKTQREYKDLPVIEIVTEGRKEVESKTDYLNASITVHSNGSGFDSLESTHVQIRGRGNSTWKWEKKPYKLKFSQDLSLFGLAPSNEWALLSNYADKSLMRNRLAYEMSKLLSFDYSPTQYCVDVFINGEYQGVYTFGEHLEAAEGRIALDQSYDPEKTGYLIEIGGVNSQIHKKGVDYFHAGTLRFALVKSPGQGALSSSQFDYISSYLIAADKAVTSGGDWRSYLDEDTLIDWILLMELTNNTDCAYRRSCYYVKNADTKLMMGPVWDFDLAFGNFNRDAKNYDEWATTTDDDYVGVTWTAHLLQDREFIKRLYLRWNEIRDELLARALEVIDETELTLSSSAQVNFTRWDVLDIRTEMQRSDVVNYDTHAEQLDYLRRFLNRRSSWLDKELTRLYEGGIYEIPVIEEE